MIKVFLYRLDEYLSKVSPATKAEKGRLISRTAYELMEKRVSELSGKAVTVKKAENGRPYIDDEPYKISISHTDSAILLALSDNDIGVDIESPRVFSEHMKERLFTDNERMYISHGNASERSTILWTMREAVCKATGEGFSDWFFGCEMVDEEGVPVTLYKKNSHIIFIRTDIIDEFIITVAALSDIKEVEFSDCALS